MKYFTIPELSKTSDPSYKDSLVQVPLGQDRDNLVTLVDRVLDPLRESWGGPICVSSGYRCPMLNEKVGGVEGSYHTRGMAADIYDPKGSSGGCERCTASTRCPSPSATMTTSTATST